MSSRNQKVVVCDHCGATVVDPDPSKSEWVYLVIKLWSYDLCPKCWKAGETPKFPGKNVANDYERYGSFET